MPKNVEGWLKEIDRAKRWQKDKWFVKAEKVVERYRDEREVAEMQKNRFNILYANTEVLKGVLYQNTPKPLVAARYKRPDPVVNAAAQILERALEYSVDEYDFDGLMMNACEDYVLPGRAVAQVRYKPTFADVEGVEQVVYESVLCENTDWEFFLHQPAKQWKKVQWIAFGELLTRDDCIAQFGKDIGNKINLTWRPKDANDEDQEAKRALVWKIWDKKQKKVLFVSDGYKEKFLGQLDDPLKLDDFFPIPQPLLACSTTNSLIPIPDFCQYQDQAIELDTLTARIAAIIDTMRRRGVYDASIGELHQLANAGDNVFIPVENYSALREKGGLKGVFDVEDFKPYADVLAGLFEQREAVKQTIYEVTGLSDIVRGATQSSETATAQRIKAQYSNIRITPRQKAINKFALELFELKAEVIAEHFSAETLQAMTGIELPQTAMEAQQLSQQTGEQVVSWEQVIALLRDQHMRCFRLDIETDVTIAPDEQAEKEAAVEMVTAFGQMMAQAQPAVESGWLPPEVAKTLLMFVMRKFRATRDVEASLEKIGQQPMPSNGEKEAEAKVEQAQIQVEQQRVQIEQQRAQFEMQSKQAESQFEAQKLQMDMQMEMQKAQFDAAIERETAQIKAQTEIQVAQIKAANEYQIAEMKAQVDAAAKIMVAQENAQVQVQTAAMTAEAGERESESAGAEKAETNGAMQATMKGLQAVIEQLGRPKEVMRGKNGEVTGIRPV